MEEYRSPRGSIAPAIAVVAFAGLVVACTSGPPEAAPVVMMGAGPGVAGQAAAQLAGVPSQAASRSVIVRPGQSVGSIARDNHVSKQAIIAANHLSPPYKIQMGKLLLIPDAAEPPAPPPAASAMAAAPPPPQPAPPAAAPIDVAPSPAPVAEAHPQPEIIPLDGPAPAKAT
ncbi:MAG TPA: LysM peptidoglycan-binding domain-containing protein, partial [Candidatus Dormibacteraeota bacterium]|nr:LysM peptidoglycan-binding domain-containing protein [Candidatus Dormibacteraeota bacterium]